MTRDVNFVPRAVIAALGRSAAGGRQLTRLRLVRARPAVSPLHCHRPRFRARHRRQHRDLSRRPPAVVDDPLPFVVLFLALPGSSGEGWRNTRGPGGADVGQNREDRTDGMAWDTRGVFSSSRPGHEPTVHVSDLRLSGRFVGRCRERPTPSQELHVHSIGPPAFPMLGRASPGGAIRFALPRGRTPWPRK